VKPRKPQGKSLVIKADISFIFTVKQGKDPYTGTFFAFYRLLLVNVSLQESGFDRTKYQQFAQQTLILKNIYYCSRAV